MPLVPDKVIDPTVPDPEPRCDSCGDYLIQPPGYRGPISQGMFGEDGPKCLTPERHKEPSKHKKHKVKSYE